MRSLILIIVLAAFGIAQAQAAQGPFHIRNEIDLPLTGAALVLAVTPQLFKDEKIQQMSLPYDRNTVFPLDRSATYFHSQSLDRFSDALIFAIPTAIVASSLPLGTRTWAESYEDLLLISEAMAITSLTNQVVRNAFRRPRPYMYDGDPSRQSHDREDVSSFFSGHTAAAFAAGVSFARIRQIRQPQSTSNGLITALAVTAGTSMGLLRVLSGDHFWTDAISGAVTGASIGYLVPELHRAGADKRGQLSLQAVGPGYVAVGMAF